LTTAACGGLRSTPDCRSRRALLHLSYSYASPYGPAILVTHGQERTHALQQTTLYSITSSARANSNGGTVRPSALAVLRLIANSPRRPHHHIIGRPDRRAPSSPRTESAKKKLATSASSHKDKASAGPADRREAVQSLPASTAQTPALSRQAHPQTRRSPEPAYPPPHSPQSPPAAAQPDHDPRPERS
jgi:hypothetical protein